MWKERSDLEGDWEVKVRVMIGGVCVWTGQGPEEGKLTSGQNLGGAYTQ